MNCILINALGCMSCIIMHDDIHKTLSDYQVKVLELDADFDDLSSYDFKPIYPVLLFYKHGEKIKEFNGEFDLDLLHDFLKEALK